MIDFKEYSRKRGVLRKRLERLVVKHPDNGRAVAILKRLKRETVAEIRGWTPRRQEWAMEKLEGWLGLKSLSLSGVKEQRALAIKRLQAEHYDVTDDNYDDFIKMMELSRSVLDGELYDSEEAATYATLNVSNRPAFLSYLADKARQVK